MRRLGVLLLALVGACRGASETDGVLVEIGSQEILALDVLELARTRSEAGLFPTSGAGFEAVRDRWIRELLVDAVLLNEAARRGIVADPRAISDADAAARGATDPKDWKVLLRERWGSELAWRDHLARRARVQAMERALRAELSTSVQVSPEQVEAARIRLAPRPKSRVRARQLHFDHEEGAREAKAELDQGTPLVEIARRLHGSDGDTGWMDPDAAPQQMLDALDPLKPEGISGIVASPLGWHIFQLVAREESPLLPEVVLGEVEARLIDEATDARIEAWIATRLDSQPPRIDEAAVTALRCCRAGVPYWDPDAVESP